MFKRTIKYTDFNGNAQVEEVFFHLSKAEIIEMEAKNVQELFEKIVKNQDKEQLVGEFKRLILAAYGQKSEDGKRFIKTPELSQEFSQTAAFDELFLELCTNENSATNFIMGILPKDLMDQVAAAVPQDKPTGPPPVPSR